MKDFRDAKSADFLYEVGNVFVPWHSDHVVLTRSRVNVV